MGVHQAKVDCSFATFEQSTVSLLPFDNPYDLDPASGSEADITAAAVVDPTNPASPEVRATRVDGFPGPYPVPLYELLWGSNTLFMFGVSYVSGAVFLFVGGPAAGDNINGIPLTFSQGRGGGTTLRAYTTLPQSAADVSGGRAMATDGTGTAYLDDDGVGLEWNITSPTDGDQWDFQFTRPGGAQASAMHASFTANAGGILNCWTLADERGQEVGQKCGSRDTTVVAVEKHRCAGRGPDVIGQWQIQVSKNGASQSTIPFAVKSRGEEVQPFTMPTHLRTSNPWSIGYARLSDGTLEDGHVVPLPGTFGEGETANVRIDVTEVGCPLLRIANAPVKVELDVTPESGGHKHIDTLAERQQAVSAALTARITTSAQPSNLDSHTDSDGGFNLELKANYLAVEVKSRFSFTLREADGGRTVKMFPADGGYVRTQTGADGLEEVTPGLWDLVVGSTDDHPKPFFLTHGALLTLTGVATEYLLTTPPGNSLLSLNDMSLENGGRFEYHGRCLTDGMEHQLHRVGLDVDVNHAGLQEGLLESIFVNGEYGIKVHESDPNKIHYRLYEP